MALQLFMDLGRLTYGSFLNLFRRLVDLPGRVISPLQGLFLYGTARYRKTRTYVYALTGFEPTTPDRAVTVVGIIQYYSDIISYAFRDSE